MADPIAALRAARGVLLDHGGPDVLPVAQAIDDWLAHGGDLADHLGMAGGWQSAHRQRQRDAALRHLAALHFPRLAGRPLARVIAAAAAAYERRSWPRDRAASRRPDGARGLIFDVLSLGPMPSEAMLRKCILTENLDAGRSPTGAARCAQEGDDHGLDGDETGGCPDEIGTGRGGHSLRCR